MMAGRALRAICQELGIRLVPISRRRMPMETCAVEALELILARHGEAHLRSVLIVIVEAGSNRRQLVGPVIWAVSDLLLAHPSWLGSKLLDAFDFIDIGDLYRQAKANRAAVAPRAGLASLLYDRLHLLFEEAS